ncbi:MAG: aminopeptidase N [Nocardioidaceae bacterium]
MTSYRSLHREEARQRAALLQVESYDVSLDLDRGESEFGSTTVISFSSLGGPTFVDVKAQAVTRVTLDGSPLDTGTLDRGRLPIETGAGAHELVVEAVMAYRNDGEGLHRSVDPADGRAYVYGMSFMDAAPFVFACFDQPDLKATFTLHVRAPLDWTVVGNTPADQVEPGVWELATTQPLSTYFVTLVAGPYHVLTDVHDGIPLGLSARSSIAKDLEADAEDLFTITRQCFDEFHRLFGIRYQFGSYHQAFVPEFNAGAMENPGCVTFRDTLVFTSRVTRGVRIQRATTVAHEMAHQWFGNLTTPVWWDDLWLNESFAEYLGVRVTADATTYDDAWVSNAYVRRQWGLIADRRPSTHPVAGNGAADAATALQDFDGISYTKGSAVLKQLAARIGDEAFLRGTVDHFESHLFGNATMADLVGSWERASGSDLSDFVAGWLGVAGVDGLAWDRGTGDVRRVPPEAHPAERTHAFRALVGTSDGWVAHPVVVGSSPATLAAPEGSAVLLDPFEDTWAVPRVDDQTVARLAELLPHTSDQGIRSGAWNALLGSLHDGLLDPAVLVSVAEAALPSETSDEAFLVLGSRVGLLESVAVDPDAVARRLHTVAVACAHAAPPGSELQLAAAQLAGRAAVEPDRLRQWLEGSSLPDGLELDLDLRWLLLCRLAELGGTDREELQHHLDADRTTVSHVEHVKAVASLPDADAKAFAWAHFTGERDAANYDLEAAAIGLWRPRQRGLTDPYAGRYFAEVAGTAAVRSGWVLAESAGDFFPITCLTESTVAAARALVTDTTIDAGIRRQLVDRTDELERRIATARAFGAAR